MIDYAAILSTLMRYDTIVLVRHIHPDCDGEGGQFALKQWLNENYPEKNVYALGREKCGQYDFPESDNVSDEVIGKSLAVVLDTSNVARVDDQRFLNAAYIIRIDHHPLVENFGNDLYIDVNASATCEILTNLFAYARLGISLKTAAYLYTGLLTDTLNFRTSNTSAATLKAAALLAENGIDIPGINRRLFDQTLAEYRFANYLRANLHIINGRMAYYVVTDELLTKEHLSPGDARNFIDEFGHVKEFEIWALFTEKKEGNVSLYDGSLRSKNTAVNDIAAKYGGGGHVNAAGVKDLTVSDLNGLINDLVALFSQ